MNREKFTENFYPERIFTPPRRCRQRLEPQPLASDVMTMITKMIGLIEHRAVSMLLRKKVLESLRFDSIGHFKVSWIGCNDLILFHLKKIGQKFDVSCQFKNRELRFVKILFSHFRSSIQNISWKAKDYVPLKQQTSQALIKHLFLTQLRDITSRHPSSKCSISMRWKNSSQCLKSNYERNYALKNRSALATNAS